MTKKEKKGHHRKPPIAFKSSGTKAPYMTFVKNTPVKKIEEKQKPQDLLKIALKKLGQGQSRSPHHLKKISSVSFNPNKNEDNVKLEHTEKSLMIPSSDSEKRSISQHD